MSNIINDYHDNLKKLISINIGAITEFFDKDIIGQEYVKINKQAADELKEGNYENLSSASHNFLMSILKNHNDPRILMHLGGDRKEQIENQIKSHGITHFPAFWTTYTSSSPDYKEFINTEFAKNDKLSNIINELTELKNVNSNEDFYNLVMQLALIRREGRLESYRDQMKGQYGIDLKNERQGGTKKRVIKVKKGGRKNTTMRVRHHKRMKKHN